LAPKDALDLMLRLSAFSGVFLCKNANAELHFEIERINESKVFQTVRRELKKRVCKVTIVILINISTGKVYFQICLQQRQWLYMP
jgi:hypothetical protein